MQNTNHGSKIPENFQVIINTLQDLDAKDPKKVEEFKDNHYKKLNARQQIEIFNYIGDSQKIALFKIVKGILGVNGFARVLNLISEKDAMSTFVTEFKSSYTRIDLLQIVKDLNTNQQAAFIENASELFSEYKKKNKVTDYETKSDAQLLFSYADRASRIQILNAMKNNDVKNHYFSFVLDHILEPNVLFEATKGFLAEKGKDFEDFLSLFINIKCEDKFNSLSKYINDNKLLTPTEVDTVDGNCRKPGPIKAVRAK